MPLDAVFRSPAAKRRHVASLFATIAGRYDLITRLLSFGQDRRWKAQLVREADVRPVDVAVDLACGTGDIALRVRQAGARLVVGVDLTPAMLAIARQKPGDVRYLGGDVARLPLAGGSADLITVGYGLRNAPDLEVAIGEMHRVLKPGGRLLSLDFNRPGNRLVRAVYLAYLDLVGGLLGRLLHGDAETYQYIPASIRRYPGAAGVEAALRARGFTEVRTIPLLFGLMTLHVARRGD